MHEGGLLMFGGSDLIMAGLGVILAAKLVRARKGVRTHLPGELAAYNVYLASLGQKNV